MAWQAAGGEPSVHYFVSHSEAVEKNRTEGEKITFQYRRILTPHKVNGFQRLTKVYISPVFYILRSRFLYSFVLSFVPVSLLLFLFYFIFNSFFIQFFLFSSFSSSSFSLLLDSDALWWLIYIIYWRVYQLNQVVNVSNFIPVKAIYHFCQFFLSPSFTPSIYTFYKHTYERASLNPLPHQCFILYMNEIKSIFYIFFYSLLSIPFQCTVDTYVRK